MGITAGSRYLGQPVLMVATSETSRTQAVFGPPSGVSPSFFYYTVIEGDRFDTLAYQIYGVADYWWRLANANPELFYPDNLIPGTIIRIPMT